MCAFVAVRAFEYRGDAAPGVHVLGMDVGGRDRAQIEALVRRWGETQVTIRAAGRTYRVPRRWLVTLDTTKTAARALAAGSFGAVVLPTRVDVEPDVSRAGGAGNVLDEIAKAGRAPVSATVSIHGTAIGTTRASDGLALDRAALLRRLVAGETSFEAPFAVEPAARRDPAARSAASTARELLAHPIAVDYHGARLGR